MVYPSRWPSTQEVRLGSDRHCSGRIMLRVDITHVVLIVAVADIRRCELRDRRFRSAREAASRMAQMCTLSAAGRRRSFQV
jgi:hypothetical protein